MTKIDFWFSIGSTYSYLTVMRLPDLAKKVGYKNTGHWCRHLILRRSMSLRPFAQSAALSLLNRLCEDFLVVSCSTECKAFMKACSADEMHQNFGIHACLSANPALT